MENWPGKWGILTKKPYMDRVMNRVFNVSGIRGCRDCHSSSRQKAISDPESRLFRFLGSPVRVSIQRGLRVLGSGCAIAFCICIMFGTLMVHVRTRIKEFAIFNLVCLCVAGYSLCSLVHNFFSSSHEALVCPGNYDLLSDPFLHDPA